MINNQLIKSMRFESFPCLSFPVGRFGQNRESRLSNIHDPDHLDSRFHGNDSRAGGNYRKTRPSFPVGRFGQNRESRLSNIHDPDHLDSRFHGNDSRAGGNYRKTRLSFPVGRFGQNRESRFRNNHPGPRLPEAGDGGCEKTSIMRNLSCVYNAGGIQKAGPLPAEAVRMKRFKPLDLLFV